MRKIFCTFAIGLVLCSAAPGLTADAPENLVKYRQSVMKSIGGHMGAIAAVVKGQASYGSHVKHHARAIKEMSEIVPDIFPPNSTYDDFKKTNALPEIWSQPEKFNQVVEGFQAAAAKFAEVADGGDKQATAVAFGELGKACGSCHKSFRYEE